MPATLRSRAESLGVVCPDCRRSLEFGDTDRIRCVSCGQWFTSQGQVLDLLSRCTIHIEDEHELFQLMSAPMVESTSREEWAKSKQSFETTVKSVIGTGVGLTIAHIGCGVDEYANSFPEAAAYISIDVTLAMLQRIEFDDADNKLLVRADVCRLPFHDAAFDVVLCIDLIHHFASRGIGAPFAELVRCLRPGGLLFLEEVNRFALYRLPFAWAPLPVLRVLRRVKQRAARRPGVPAPYEAPISLRHLHRATRAVAPESVNSVQLRKVFPCLEYPASSAMGGRLFRGLAARIPFVSKRLGYHWFALFVKDGDSGRPDVPTSWQQERST